MANVAVMNMNGEQVGNIDLNDAIFGKDKAHKAQKHVQKCVAVVENLGDRKVQAEQDKAPFVPLNGLAVA